MLLHSQKISEWCWVSDPLIPLQVKAGGIARVMQLSDAETAPAHVFAARAAAVPRRWSIKLCLAFTFAASCVSALCKQELVCRSKTSRANSCCFFSGVYRARCSPQPRSRASLAVPAWSAFNQIAMHRLHTPEGTNRLPAWTLWRSRIFGIAAGGVDLQAWRICRTNATQTWLGAPPARQWCQPPRGPW